MTEQQAIDPKSLKAENDDLREIIANIWWMAREYADGRSSYAPALFNQCIEKAIANGVTIKDDNGNIYAADGHYGKWNPKTRMFEKLETWGPNHKS